MTVIIAEISNMHGGCMTKARELIKMAADCGADLVKGQAFLAEDMMKHGVMSKEFYKKCALKYDQYIDLIEYARMIGTEFFCSVISQKYNNLHQHQKYRKVTGGQFLARNTGNIKRSDVDNSFISMPKLKQVELKKATLMYVEPYMGLMDFKEYSRMIAYYKRPIGLSHHNKTLDSIYRIKDRFILPAIEKHFYDGKVLSDKKNVYRDCHHAADPKTFQAIARMFK